jgi:hypothetical protein
MRESPSIWVRCLEEAVAIDLGIPRHSRLPIHQRRESHTRLHTVEIWCNIIVDAERRTQERYANDRISKHTAPGADLGLAPVEQRIR